MFLSPSFLSTYLHIFSMMVVITKLVISTNNYSLGHSFNIIYILWIILPFSLLRFSVSLFDSFISEKSTLRPFFSIKSAVPNMSRFGLLLRFRVSDFELSFLREPLERKILNIFSIFKLYIII